MTVGVYHQHTVTSLPADPNNSGKVQPSWWAEGHKDGNGNNPPTWAVDGSNNATGLVGPDGTTIVSPRVLVQSAIPFILAGGTSTSKFTLDATGALSNLPTLVPTSGFAFFFMPTGITGLATGWYYGEILTATTAQLSTATYVSGDPLLAVPTTFTNPAGITAGDYSQTTATDIQAMAIVMPGGTMGPNGSLRVMTQVSMTASGNNKTFRVRAGTTSISGVAGTLSSTGAAGLGTFFHNVNSQSINKANNNGSAFQPFATAAGSFGFLTVNTAADQTINFSLNIATATDYCAHQIASLEVIYGA